ncbi:MAG: hypothetical protein ABSH56_12245 [Bryobacteraceae bacterium]
MPVGFWISVDIEDMFEWKDEHSVPDRRELRSAMIDDCAGVNGDGPAVKAVKQPGLAVFPVLRRRPWLIRMWRSIVRVIGRSIRNAVPWPYVNSALDYIFDLPLRRTGLRIPVGKLLTVYPCHIKAPDFGPKLVASSHYDRNKDQQNVYEGETDKHRGLRVMCTYCDDMVSLAERVAENDAALAGIHAFNFQSSLFSRSASLRRSIGSAGLAIESCNTHWWKRRLDLIDISLFLFQIGLPQQDLREILSLWVAREKMKDVIHIYSTRRDAFAKKLHADEVKSQTPPLLMHRTKRKDVVPGWFSAARVTIFAPGNKHVIYHLGADTPHTGYMDSLQRKVEVRIGGPLLEGSVLQVEGIQDIFRLKDGLWWRDPQCLDPEIISPGSRDRSRGSQNSSLRTELPLSPIP